MSSEGQVRGTAAYAIREARVKKRLTQAELAEASGVSRQAIWRLENGTREPLAGTLTSIAGVCGGRFVVDRKGVRYARS